MRQPVFLTSCLAVLLVAGSVSSTNAAPPLRPLSDVLATGNDNATLSYFALRCTAVLLEASDQLKVDGSPDMAPMAENLLAESKQFFTVVIGLSTAPEDAKTRVAIDNVQSLSAMYHEEMRANFLATGNRFEGLVAADIQLCSAAKS